MAKPPDGYPSETGTLPCGSSWHRGLAVDGSTPTLPFGKDFRRVLPPLAASPLPSLGFNRPDEQDLLGELLDKADFLEEQVGDRVSGGFYSPSEGDSLQWLLSRARAQIRRVSDIYAKWADRAERPWSLETADTLSALDSRCRGYGQKVLTSDFSAFTCPTLSEVKQRPRDRATITRLATDALHHIRCAEYGSARLELYKQARRVWQAQQAPSGLATPTERPPPHEPGETPGVGGIVGGPVEMPDGIPTPRPFEPFEGIPMDEILPQPPSADPDDPGLDDDAVGEGEPIADRIKSVSLGTKVLYGVGILLAGSLLFSVFRK